ncbi:MAG: cobalamin-dependent protein [Tissierellaceae bacterium]|nr:cobalamin-dependent protein [Tissierellaceae bacterium]
MSLLMNYNDTRFINIAQIIFEEQFKRDPKLEQEMDERRKKLMYDDVVYNISYLSTAIYFNDAKIFEEYAIWLYELLCNLMKDLGRDRIMIQMIDHYIIMSEILEKEASDILSKEELVKAQKFLERAIKVTKEAALNVPLTTSFLEGKHANIRRAYLNAILSSDTRLAHKVIHDARNQGISIADIYEEILAKVMYEIGALWHKNIITIAKEHYASSVTQTIISSFYNEIFSQPKKGLTLVSCAIGSELHEMGIRMLSDIFEYEGWDTYYLGSALPEASLIESIENLKPDLVSISVTMQPYLSICEKTIIKIREKFPHVKIAVGGQAFLTTDELWKKWDIDFYTTSAKELAKWAGGQYDK